MDSIGERLKKARMDKGLSLDEVHKKTNIHIPILEALEGDRLINKAPVYVKGFLKIYCEFLGLNPEDFIPDFKKLEVSSDYLKAYQRPILPKPTVRLSAFRPHFKIIRILAIAILLIFLGWSAVKLANVHKKKGAVAYLKERKTESIAPQRQIPSDTIRLGIRAVRGDCWIKAKVDGKVTFADVLKKGRFESWQAKERIELSLGNAGGIDLELNGKLISPLGRRGQVIKRILITKEGLQIN